MEKSQTDDIDRMFKSVKPKMSRDYCNLRDAYGKYLKAKTDNDKKRLANEFEFYYKNFSSL